MNQPFHLEIFWIDHPTFQNSVKEWWDEEKHIEGMTMYQF